MASRRSESNQASSPSVLIADDDALLREILEHKLSMAGYEVSVFEDGRAVLEAARAARPQVVVLDGMMPIIDGFEVLRRMKGDNALRDIPVVMLTALKGRNDIVTALNLGAADYLPKPFDPDELLARLFRIAPVAA
ncbi:response regulator [Caulobacter sp. D4A]|uniref:response regulator transcription factor n=1 Tax=unclassified Caulobacter TaxID=2648921 RepID=UPI000D729C4B|nr:MULTISPECIES: response regulator [unclassified Caulobacter]PXA85306.1 response regulator [Caulobacter sp. D4A]PXA93799.1 response regulator [Caulobacter sp. D5]